MSKADLITQTQFTDLTDDQIRDRLGFLWETIKRLKELGEQDQQLAKMKADYKELHLEKYGTEIKDLAKKLKACRKIAELREIYWTGDE